MASTGTSGRTLPDFEIQQLHHPPVHQKLQLVSQDIRFLQKIFLDAAKNKINTHLPSQSAEDSLRSEVEARMNEFISKTFDLAKYSLVVNGVEATDPSLGALMNANEVDKQEEQDVEPFDLELNEQVRQLYAQIDEETVAVTTLRREAPLRAIESYTAQLAEIDSKSYVLQDDDDDIEADTPDFDINQIIPRRDTVESDFDQLVVSIREMKKRIPDAIAKVERAEAAITHLTVDKKNL
ncbi:kinetochore protein Mis14 like-domain-containing protein [Kockiozyma suomiensis]|uniref:kinetochore protein Mis14 like-domain-containing protein n=1 Tax=Kockiozyma suomiensis TaxID=1337062 RepID=UPI003343F405